MAPIPRTYFRYIEPSLLVFGALNLFLSGASSAPSYLSTAPHPPLPTEHFLALQAGSMMLLSAALLATIMWTSTEIKVIRAAVWVLAVSDVPHWVLGFWCLGDLKWEWGGWSGEMRAFMGVPVLTFGVKVMYLLGWLGGDCVGGGDGEKKRL